MNNDNMYDSILPYMSNRNDKIRLSLAFQKHKLNNDLYIKQAATFKLDLVLLGLAYRWYLSAGRNERIDCYKYIKIIWIRIIDKIEHDTMYERLRIFVNPYYFKRILVEIKNYINSMRTRQNHLIPSFNNYDTRNSAMKRICSGMEVWVTRTYYIVRWLDRPNVQQEWIQRHFGNLNTNVNFHNIYEFYNPRELFKSNVLHPGVVRDHELTNYKKKQIFKNL